MRLGRNCQSRAMGIPGNGDIHEPSIAIILAIDDIFTIHPRSPDGCGSCRSICPRAYLQPRKTDFALTFIVKSHCSSSAKCRPQKDHFPRPMPALLTILHRSARIRMVISSPTIHKRRGHTYLIFRISQQKRALAPPSVPQSRHWFPGRWPPRLPG